LYSAFLAYSDDRRGFCISFSGFFPSCSSGCILHRPFGRFVTFPRARAEIFIVMLFRSPSPVVVPSVLSAMFPYFADRPFFPSFLPPEPHCGLLFHRLIRFRLCLVVSLVLQEILFPGFPQVIRLRSNTQSSFFLFFYGIVSRPFSPCELFLPSWALRTLSLHPSMFGMF